LKRGASGRRYGFSSTSRRSFKQSSNLSWAQILMGKTNGEERSWSWDFLPLALSYIFPEISWGQMKNYVVNV
jgi:hypothetical protein